MFLKKDQLISSFMWFVDTPSLSVLQTPKNQQLHANAHSEQCPAPRFWRIVCCDGLAALLQTFHQSAVTTCLYSKQFSALQKE